MSYQDVLLVVDDTDLLWTLRTLLEEADFGVVGCTDGRLAAQGLQVVATPMIVLIWHGSNESLWRPILDPLRDQPGKTGRASVLPHAYLLLSTRVERAPHVWNPYTRREIPALAAPFSLDTLVAAMAVATSYLRAPLALPIPAPVLPDVDAEPQGRRQRIVAVSGLSAKIAMSVEHPPCRELALHGALAGRSAHQS
ncbi:MAG TPA: hypothetical protein VMV29_06725 [Ktedonobacterales bacterium]|nr:hypothetical protein [Ktedonobacterales bacterium]